MSEYSFSNDWFNIVARATWQNFLPSISPRRILEIGSYEGQSTCFMIDCLNHNLEIVCVDTWTGGVEHSEIDFSQVEKRFHDNIKLAISSSSSQVKVDIKKGNSFIELAKLSADGKQNFFDLIYIDGSHQAVDVLSDAILSFKLLNIGGVMIFDDYLWSESIGNELDPIRSPKIAIDAFTNVFCRKIKILQAPLYQLFIQKLEN